MQHQVIIGDSREELSKFPDNHFDAIVTDPPYGGFLHQYSWDSPDVVFSSSFWKEIYRTLKPGGFVVAFAMPRLYHRLAIAVEDSGFKLYPQMIWDFPGGLPKPVNLAELFDRDNIKNRKSTGHKKGSGFTKANADHGAQQRLTKDFVTYERGVSEEAKKWSGYYYGNNCLKPRFESILLAQKPPSEKRMIDNVRVHGVGALNLGRLKEHRGSELWPDGVFTHAKAKKKDHNSNHPSVKPVSLMEELCILACPPGGMILDPFSGTGTTSEAAAKQGFQSTAIEMNPDMKPVIESRLSRVSVAQDPVKFWDDLPGNILLEDCYVSGCTTQTTGGGTKSGETVSLCPLHRTKDGFESAVVQLRSWKT
jgi:DNA modification methylase